MCEQCNEGCLDEWECESGRKLVGKWKLERESVPINDENNNDELSVGGSGRLEFERKTECVAGCEF